MTKRKVSYLQGLEGTRYQLPAEDHRLNRAALWTPASAGVRARSGVVPGPGTAVVTATTGGVNIAPGHVVVQGTTTGVQGVYECTWDAAEFRATPAASASTYRRFLIVARVYDRVSGGAAKDDWDLEAVLGGGAATLGAAVEPAVPANSFVLRRGSVAPDGAVSLTTELPDNQVARGGVLPVTATDTTPGSYVGQYRDTPANGLERWTGTGWYPERTRPVSLAFYTAFAHFDPWMRARFWREGRTVYTQGLITIGPGQSMPAGQEWGIFTLPSEFRPLSAQMFLGALGGSQPIRMDMEVNGTLELVNSANRTIGAGEFIAFNTFHSIDAPLG